MPHIIIECSQPCLQRVNTRRLLHTDFDAVLVTAQFEPDNIKVRLHPVTDFKLGLSDSDYMHVVCRMHVVKSLPQKQLLTRSVLHALEALFEEANIVIVITVEVVDIHKAIAMLKRC